MKNEKNLINPLYEEELKKESEILSDDLLFDYKLILKDYYHASICEQNNCVILKFKNGQNFKISINEIFD